MNLRGFHGSKVILVTRHEDQFILNCWQSADMLDLTVIENLIWPVELWCLINQTQTAEVGRGKQIGIKRG